MNEFIEENMRLYFLVGVISTILVFFVLIIGVVRLLIFFFIQKKEIAITYFALANLCLLIAFIFVVWLFIELLTASTGSVSGLMIPLVMPAPAFFCIFYIIFSIKSVKKRKISKK